ATDVLAFLKKNGKPSTAAIYKRHGSGDNVYGVLTSEMAKLLKKIKIDHALAMELWKSGNAEARVLALQIADPAKVTSAEAERLLEGSRSRFVSGYLAMLLAKSPVAQGKMKEWMASKDEFVSETGYTL